MNKGASIQGQRARAKSSSSDAPPEQAQRAVGRPRSEAARGAILEAAYALLLETQLGGFSIDAVAARAGVARTAIYCWWPTKGRLAIESFFEAFRPKHWAKALASTLLAGCRIAVPSPCNPSRRGP